MFDEKKLWKLKVYAERVWRLALDLAMQGAKLGDSGKGLIATAEETRTFANRLYERLEDTSGIVETVKLVETLKGLNLLTLNNGIEAAKLRLTIGQDAIAGAILLEETRNLTIDLMSLIDCLKPEYMEIPEVSCPSCVVDTKLCLLQAEIAGQPIVENIRYIDEIVWNEKKSIGEDSLGKTIRLRGNEIPILDCSRCFTVTPAISFGKIQEFMIVNIDWCKPDIRFAVPVDMITINSIFWTRMGTRGVVRPDAILQEYVRECWDAEGGKQMLFIDWSRLAEGCLCR